jgi:hypothetical protein
MYDEAKNGMPEGTSTYKYWAVLSYFQIIILHYLNPTSSFQPNKVSFPFTSGIRSSKYPLLVLTALQAADLNHQNAVQACNRRPFLHLDVDRLRHPRCLQGWLERHQHLRGDLLSLRRKHSYLRGGNYLRPDLYLRYLSVSRVCIPLAAKIDVLLRCWFQEHHFGSMLGLTGLCLEGLLSPCGFRSSWIILRLDVRGENDRTLFYESMLFFGNSGCNRDP